MILIHVFKHSKSIDEIAEFLAMLAEQRSSSYFEMINFMRQDPLVHSSVQVKRLARGIVEVNFFRADAPINDEPDSASGNRWHYWRNGEPVNGCIMSATLHALSVGSRVEFACIAEEYQPEFRRMLAMFDERLPEVEPAPEIPVGAASPLTLVQERLAAVGRQLLEAAVIARFLWQTRGHYISFSVHAAGTSSTPDVELNIFEPMQPGDSVSFVIQGPLGEFSRHGAFWENHEYELREMRRVILAAGLFLDDDSFIRDCIRKWYRGITLTPEQYGKVLTRGYHKPITVEVDIDAVVGVGRVAHVGSPVHYIDPDTIRLSRIQPSGVQSGEAFGLPSITGEAHGVLDVTVAATATVRNRVEAEDLAHVREAVTVELSALGMVTGVPQMSAGSAPSQIVLWIHRLDERIRRSEDRQNEWLKRLEHGQARIEQLLSAKQPELYTEGTLRRHIEKIASKQAPAFNRLFEIVTILEAEGLNMRAKDLARLLGIPESTVNTYLKRIRDSTENLY